MKSLFKISKSKLIALAVIIPVLAAGSVFAYHVITPSKITDDATQVGEQAALTSKTDKQIRSSKQVDETQASQAANGSAGTAPKQTTTQTSTATKAQPSQTTTNTTTSQQSAAAPTQVTPTCNESMKSSYTSLYNSKVASENADWSNQVTAWNNYASSHGMAFSGYVQGMVNDNKPAHDARLAQLQTQYYQNLASINCN